MDVLRKAEVFTVAQIVSQHHSFVRLSTFHVGYTWHLL